MRTALLVALTLAALGGGAACGASAGRARVGAVREAFTCQDSVGTAIGTWAVAPGTASIATTGIGLGGVNPEVGEYPFAYDMTVEQVADLGARSLISLGLSRTSLGDFVPGRFDGDLDCSYHPITGALSCTGAISSPECVGSLPQGTGRIGSWQLDISCKYRHVVTTITSGAQLPYTITGGPCSGQRIFTGRGPVVCEFLGGGQLVGNAPLVCTSVPRPDGGVDAAADAPPENDAAADAPAEDGEVIDDAALPESSPPDDAGRDAGRRDTSLPEAAGVIGKQPDAACPNVEPVIVVVHDGGCSGAGGTRGGSAGAASLVLLALLAALVRRHRNG